MSERPLQPPIGDEPPAPPDPIVGNEPELVTGMGGGDDPIVEGVEMPADLEAAPWSDGQRSEEAAVRRDAAGS